MISILLNYLNIILVLINILIIFRLKCLQYKHKSIPLFDLRGRMFIDGILIIELLYFFALYVWIQAGASELIGGITEPSEFLYTIAEYVKSIYFMCAGILMSIDTKNKIKNFLGDKEHGRQS